MKVSSGDFTIPDFGERKTSKEAVAALEGPIGRIVVGWSYIDQNIDIFAREVARYQGLPVVGRKNFDDKLKAIKKGCRTIPALAPSADRTRSVLTTASELARLRHRVVHWTLTHSFGTDAVVFTKIDYDSAERPFATDQLYTLQGLRDAADEIHNIAREILRIVHGR